LILLAFCGYLAIFVRGVFKRHWRGWLVMFGVTAVLALPLLLTLQQQPESEGRVTELAVPLIEARAGNFQPLLQYTLTTLGMFHATGDSEWLYNIANRPLFNPITAIFFWLGVLICLWQSLQSLAPPPSPLPPRHSPLATRHSPLATRHSPTPNPSTVESKKNTIQPSPNHDHLDHHDHLAPLPLE